MGGWRAGSELRRIVKIGREPEGTAACVQRVRPPTFAVARVQTFVHRRGGRTEAIVALLQYHRRDGRAFHAYRAFRTGDTFTAAGDVIFLNAQPTLG